MEGRYQSSTYRRAGKQRQKLVDYRLLQGETMDDDILGIEGFCRSNGFRYDVRNDINA